MKYFWCILFFPLGLLAQQPSHYVLGEKELEGVDIYKIHHATDQNYYLATSSGLIVYDGYDFIPATCQSTLTSSVFNLVEDHAGNLYYNNLSGQIFKFSEGACHLYYTLPDSLTSADIGLEIDDQNRLVVRANGLIFLNAKAEEEVYHHLGYSGFATRMKDKSLWFYSEKEERFVAFKNGEYVEQPRFSNESGGTGIYNLLPFQDMLYRYELNTCKLFEMNMEEKLLIDPESIITGQVSNRMYATSNSIWLAPNLAGVYQFDKNLNLVNREEPFFPKTVISAVCEDAEGNILFGTFGNGLIVIPNERTLDFVLPDKEEKVISIDRSGNGTLYFGTLSGKIYKRFNNDVSLFRDGEAKRMESLFVGEDEIVIGDFNGALIDMSTGAEKNLEVGSIKDLQFVDQTKALIGSNMGAFWVNIKSGESKQLSNLMFRHFCIGYNASTGSVYSGTTKGLIIVNEDGQSRLVKMDGKPIGARRIEAMNDRMYVGTSDQGVLVFEKDSLQSRWNATTGLLSNTLHHLQVSEDKIIVSTDKGVQVLNTDGNTLHVIQNADGLGADRVTDFEFFDDELWVVHAKGVQIFNLNDLNQDEFIPKLELRSITVNDTSFFGLDQTHFAPDQQKFEFDLKVSSLRYQNEIRYQYRLEGAETEWQSSSYSNHVIQYQSLASGDYMFRAKAVCSNVGSEELTYTFTVATPFYMAWWFYLLVSIGLIFGVILWFRNRLKRQAFLSQQQNELNASKLTAIQSQMNPHFIFNALNSIQDLVLKGDVSNSYTYITKFADLVRRTLNYSDKDFIDFENELKLIELYLTLEKLRFKTDFEYTIESNGIDDIQIPPMLVQPFIENALVHGLLHREGAKRLDLKFELNDNLVCTITDNGVGRKKAREIKERQRSSHESFSVNAIRKRFEILQRNFGGDLGFITEDLQDDGNPAGTRVKLVIPVKRKY